MTTERVREQIESSLHLERVINSNKHTHTKYSLSKSTKKSTRGTAPLSLSTCNRFPMTSCSVEGGGGEGGEGEYTVVEGFGTFY